MEYPDIEQIRGARRRLGDLVRETPVWRWQALDLAAILGAETEVFLKLELFQHTGSFKPRGALTVMLCTGDGPVAMTLNADGQPAPADKEGTGSHSGKPCSFAAAHVLAVPPLGELAAHVTAVFVHSAPLPVAVSARQAPAHSLADSRAPPAFL